MCPFSFFSSLLQRPDANPGVQPRNENCVEFSQAPADGKDPVHPRLPCRPQDIKERKSAHPQHEPSPLRSGIALSSCFPCFDPPHSASVVMHLGPSIHKHALTSLGGGGK